MSGGDNAGLIDRTRHTRITPETAPIFRGKTKLCQWCGRAALRGKLWCQRHGPGKAKDRRDWSRRRGVAANAARLLLVTAERGAEVALPVWAHLWPPMARAIAIVPRTKRTVLVADMVRALVEAACGDGAPWADMVHRLREAGLMLPDDPTLPDMRARSFDLAVR
jgi:hypothetical protein